MTEFPLVPEPREPSMRTIASICRCSSPQMHADRAMADAAASARSARESAKAESDRRAAELAARTPDPDQYEVVKVERVGPHLVLQVRYPSCTACAFEGLKTMVFLNASEVDSMRWRRIDPHFRAAPEKQNPRAAPSPAARFPGTSDGWSDAIGYARSKVTPPKVMR